MPMITEHRLPLVSLKSVKLFFFFFRFYQVVGLHVPVRNPLINKLGLKRYFLFVYKCEETLWHLDLSLPGALAGCTGSDKKPSIGLPDNGDLKPK